MSGDFEGDDFVGLDADLFGGRSNPGSSDSNSRPLSTYAENRIDGNTRFLGEIADRFQYSFGGVGVELSRRYASMNRRWILHLPYIIQPEDTKIRFKVLGFPGSDGSNDQDLKLWGHVFFPREDGQRNPSSTTINAPAGGASSDDVFEVTHSISGGQRGGERLGIIRLGMEQGTLEQESGDNTKRKSRMFYRDTSSGSIWTDQDEGRALKVNQGSEDDFIDTYHADDAGPEEPRGSISKRDFRGRNDGSPGQIQVKFIPWFKFKSVSIEVLRDLSVERSRIIEKNPVSMRAQETVEGGDVSQHGQSMDETWARSRCLATGPFPESSSTSDSPGSSWTTRKWKWIEEIDSTNTTAEIDSQVGWVPQKPTTIRWIGLVYLWRQVEQNGTTGSWADYDKKLQDDEDTAFVSRGDAQFSLRILQPQKGDSDWGSVSAADQTQETSHQVPIYPAGRGEGVNVPNITYWARHPTSFGSVNSEYKFTFKEGMTRKGDFKVVQPFEISTDADFGDLDPSIPFRMKVTWDGFSGGVDDPQDDKFSTVSYHLTLLSSSFLQEGIPKP